MSSNEQPLLRSCEVGKQFDLIAVPEELSSTDVARVMPSSSLLCDVR
jgi:hypothetical protein